jgi:replicative superfamily II helicase
MFNKEHREILFSLVRNAGLFPYLEGNLELLSDDDLIAYELHRSEELEGIVFHSLQAKIYNLIIGGSNVVLSASTSVGKSLVVDAVISFKRFSQIVLIVPTIALIDETRRRISKRFGNEVGIITHRSQSVDSEKTTVFLLTQERVLIRDDLDAVDLVIVDEFYKMKLSEEYS